MKLLTLLLSLFFSAALYGEIWEKPPYKPDEGHLQEEIEKQEERPTQEKNKKEGKHQDVGQPDSSPTFEMIDDEMSEDEEAVP